MQSKDDVLQTSLDPLSEAYTVLEKREYVQSSLTILTPLADAKKVDIMQSPESTEKENSTAVLNYVTVAKSLKKNPWFSCCFSFVLEDVVIPSVVAAQTHGVAALNLNLAVEDVIGAAEAAAEAAVKAAEDAVKAAEAAVEVAAAKAASDLSSSVDSPVVCSVKPAKSSRVSKAAKAASLAAKAVVQYIQ